MERRGEQADVFLPTFIDRMSGLMHDISFEEEGQY